MQLILLQDVEPSGFAFWFITEAFFAIIVFALLYYFIVKNPKINRPPRNEKKD